MSEMVDNIGGVEDRNLCMPPPKKNKMTDVVLLPNICACGKKFNTCNIYTECPKCRRSGKCLFVFNDGSGNATTCGKKCKLDVGLCRHHTKKQYKPKQYVRCSYQGRKGQCNRNCRVKANGSSESCGEPDARCGQHKPEVLEYKRKYSRYRYLLKKN